MSTSESRTLVKLDEIDDPRLRFALAIRNFVKSPNQGDSSTMFCYHGDYALDEVTNDIRQLRNIPALNSIHIEHCYALARISPAICDVLNIRWLNLSYNALVTIPNEIGRLRNLERLFLNNNRLVCLPTDVWGLQQLEELRLDGNKLCYLPSGILFLPALRDITVENNPLVTPEAIEGAEVVSLFVGNPPLLPISELGSCANCNIHMTFLRGGVVKGHHFFSFSRVATAAKVPILHSTDSLECQQHTMNRVEALQR